MLEVCWDSQLRQSSGFSWICFYSSIGNDEAQQFSSGDAEDTFFGLSLMSYVRKLSNVSLKSSIRVSTCLVLMTATSGASIGFPRRGEGDAASVA